VGVVGGISAITSQKKCKVDGILADGKTVVVAARMRVDNNYEIYIHSIEMPGSVAFVQSQSVKGEIPVAVEI